jgi:tRNA-modifying protein YgfZ
MNETTPGYRALREGAAWLDLTGRGVIRVTGEDRARLLHAMTTNKIQGIQPGQWRYAFFLSAQGRMLADANVVCTEHELLLDVEPGSREFLLDHLDKFIIADDVELTDISDETAVVSLEGPTAEALAASLSHKAWPISSTGAPAVRFYVPLAVKPALISVLNSGGAVAATAGDAEKVRLEHARPRYGADLTADHIPHEARLGGAVHFSKGCYIGQEIVERVRSRGRPNRLLTHFEIEGSEPIANGEKLLADGKEVGQITSSAYSPAEERTLAFGYVRTEFADPGKHVLAGTRTANASGRFVEVAATN